MSMIKAVIFDFIGTLVTVENYSYSNSEKKLHGCLRDAGFDTDYLSFTKAYEAAHEKYRNIRFRQLVEVTNAVWVSEALNALGHGTTPNDENITQAVNQFFEDYVQSLKPRTTTKRVLDEIKPHFALGLVSNFTYAPVIHAGLKTLKLSEYFDSVLVSQDFGWRKPSPRVFQEILSRLGIAGGEAVYVGDSPEEDIKGAQNAGMKTIFIPSQFYGLEDLTKASVHPHMRITDLVEILPLLKASHP